MNHLTQAIEPHMHDIEASFDMANLRPATTGIPFVVFVSQQAGARHGPRIELSPLPRYNPAEAITVTLQSPPPAIGNLAPSDLALVTIWIERNREPLAAYWRGTIEFTEDLIARITPV